MVFIQTSQPGVHRRKGSDTAHAGDNTGVAVVIISNAMMATFPIKRVGIDDVVKPMRCVVLLLLLLLEEAIYRMVASEQLRISSLYEVR